MMLAMLDDLGDDVGDAVFGGWTMLKIMLGMLDDPGDAVGDDSGDAPSPGGCCR